MAVDRPAPDDPIHRLFATLRQMTERRSVDLVERTLLRIRRFEADPRFRSPPADEVVGEMTRHLIGLWVDLANRHPDARPPRGENR